MACGRWKNLTAYTGRPKPITPKLNRAQSAPMLRQWDELLGLRNPKRCPTWSSEEGFRALGTCVPSTWTLMWVPNKLFGLVGYRAFLWMYSKLHGRFSFLAFLVLPAAGPTRILQWHSRVVDFSSTLKTKVIVSSGRNSRDVVTTWVPCPTWSEFSQHDHGFHWLDRYNQDPTPRLIF